MDTSLKCSELTGRIIQVFFAVYNELGFGFLESVYEEAIGIALDEAGLAIERPEFRRFAFDNERKQTRVYPRVSAAKSSL